MRFLSIICGVLRGAPSRLLPLCALSPTLFALSLLPAPAQNPSSSPSAPALPDLFNHVIVNQKKSDSRLDEFERIERLERRRTSSDRDSVDTKVWRLFPTGTGVDKIALSNDGLPPGTESYRSDLEKLEKYLAWAAQEGSAQKEARAKAEHKRKDRYDLIEATRQAFRFTFEGQELRGDRTLLRYSVAPNPQYKPTSRNTTLLTKVRGTLWIDQQSSELAKIEGSITEDVSLALFLAKVYKGSHFLQERYEVAPGVWEPTFEQYDFDGRKFLLPFSIHERTTYSGYKQVGPPREAVEVLRAELGKLHAEQPAR